MIKSLIDEYTQYRAKLTLELSQCIKQEFKVLFDNNPRLAGIYWNQFLPTFNDGDPCEFIVHSPEFLFFAEDIGQPSISEEIVSYLGDEDYIQKDYGELFDISCTNKVQDTNSFLQVWDTLYPFMQDIFGLNVVTFVTRDCIYTGEYYDY